MLLFRLGLIIALTLAHFANAADRCADVFLAPKDPLRIIEQGRGWSPTKLQEQSLQRRLLFAFLKLQPGTQRFNEQELSELVRKIQERYRFARLLMDPIGFEKRPEDLPSQEQLWFERAQIRQAFIDAMPAEPEQAGRWKSIALIVRGIQATTYFFGAPFRYGPVRSALAMRNIFPDAEIDPMALRQSFSAFMNTADRALLDKQARIELKSQRFANARLVAYLFMGYQMLELLDQIPTAEEQKQHEERLREEQRQQSEKLSQALDLLTQETNEQNHVQCLKKFLDPVFCQDFAFGDKERFAQVEECSKTEEPASCQQKIFGPIERATEFYQCVRSFEDRKRCAQAIYGRESRK